MKSIYFLFAITILLFGNNGTVLSEIPSNVLKIEPRLQSDGSIILPQELKEHTAIQSNIQTSDILKNWEDTPNLNIILDYESNSIRRAFGEPIKIEGYSTITKENVVEVSLKFLTLYQEKLNIDVKNLKLKRVSEANKRFYVSFIQLYEGLDVLLSEIELRIFENGNIMAFGALYYNDIDIRTTPKFSAEELLEKATIGLDSKKSKATVLSKDKMYILPVKFGNSISYRLVYDIRVESIEPLGNYITYVDANTGDVLWRLNQINNATTTINLSGGVKLTSPLDDETTVPFANTYVTVNGQKYISDKNGNITLNLDTDVNYELEFSGTVGKVGRTNTISDYENIKATYTKIKGTIESGKQNNIVLDNSNSKMEERTIYYHLHKAYEYYKKFDPESTVMDREMNVVLELSGQMVNAFSNWETIVFLNINDNSYKMAQGPSVLYHEWGHSMNNFFYREHGNEEGMINRAAHEGTADLYSSLILDEPIVGKGYITSNPNEFIRTIDNENKYPYDVTGESHHDGLILGGAFWDIRKETSTEYVAHLSHYARYGLPDDIDVGTAYSMWFIETLIADDDDGDLSNGTPNHNIIVKAFNKHGIGTDLLLKNNFSHTPHPDTKKLKQPYIIEFSLNKALSFNDKSFSSPTIHYKVNKTSDYQTVNAVQTDVSNIWWAEIPGLDNFGYVQYYISVWDEIAEQTIEFYADNNNKTLYGFLVNYDIIFRENFEIASGWSIGASGDNATTGKWEIAKPNGITNIYIEGEYFQAPKNVSDDNDKCFITDATYVNVQNQFDIYEMIPYMANGKTTVISPNYDLTEKNNLIVKFWYWFFVFKFFQSQVEPSFTFDVSSDGGSSWNNIITKEEATSNWNKQQFFLEDYINLTSQVRFRFAVNNNPNIYAFVESAFDELQFLIPNQGVSVEEDKLSDFFLNCYPNPIEENATFEIMLPYETYANIEIFDIQGNKMAVVANNTFLNSGINFINWNRTDLYGNTISAGIYNYVISFGETRKFGKIVVY